MSQSLEQIRSANLTSIYGRRLGLNANGFLGGPQALKMATQSIGSSTNSTVSTTGTEIINYGVTSLAVATEAATTGSSYGTAETGGVFALAAPEPGVEKTIYTASQHSTMAIVVAMSTDVFIQSSSLGSSFGGITFNAPNQFVRLIGVSTSKWLQAAMSTGVVMAAT